MRHRGAVKDINKLTTPLFAKYYLSLWISLDKESLINIKYKRKR